jgi:hypothetical protein
MSWNLEAGIGGSVPVRVALVKIWRLLGGCFAVVVHYPGACWKFIMRPPIQMAAGSFLSDTAPLLEEQGNSRLPALVAEIADPGRRHLPGAVAALATDDITQSMPRNPTWLRSSMSGSKLGRVVIS